jgi:hypothetical protein
VSTIPIELPVKPSEAAALADLIFGHAEGRPITDEVRNRLAGRLATLGLTSLIPHMGSLQKDPVHSSAYYLAIDAIGGGSANSLLLRMALASSPASALFPDSILIGRMRPAGGREIVVNAIAFGLGDVQNIRRYAEHIDRSFFPRPQGSQSAIAIRVAASELDLPACFDAFRQNWKSTGLNLASIATNTEADARHFFYAAIWAAIRAGWREGYNAGVERLVIAGSTPAELAHSIEAAKDYIFQAPDFTRFVFDTSALFDSEHAAPSWIISEFEKPIIIAEQSYVSSLDRARGLAIKFGRSLAMLEELYDFAQSVKSDRNTWKYFDFEPSFESSGMETTPEELAFCLHWLRARGRPAHLIAPRFGNIETAPLSEMAAIARVFNATLSIRLPVTTPQLLQRIGRSTSGRFNCAVDSDFLRGDSEGEDAREMRRAFARSIVAVAANLRS